MYKFRGFMESHRIAGSLLFVRGQNFEGAAGRGTNTTV